MNYSTAIFLVRRDVRAVLCIYEPDTDAKKSQRYLFKTMDPTIKVDDLVMVPSDAKFGFSVNKVVEVDVPVDFESSTQIKWIAGRFDKSAYDAVTSTEANVISTIRSAQERKKREELAEALLKDNPELDSFKTMQITGTVIDAASTT